MERVESSASALTSRRPWQAGFWPEALHQLRRIATSYSGSFRLNEGGPCVQSVQVLPAWSRQQADAVRRVPDGKETNASSDHKTRRPCSTGAILALVGVGSAALANLMPFDKAICEGAQLVYGEGKWFMFWDEDLSGKPIRGTISLAYGRRPWSSADQAGLAASTM
jgi:hypothetical protein